MVKPAAAVIALVAMVLFTSFVPAPYTGGTVGQPVRIVPAVVFSHSITGGTVTKDNDLFSRWGLHRSGIPAGAFAEAYKGYTQLAASGQLRNTRMLTIIDFSKPSSQKRLFVINMRTGRLVLQSLVAHGQGSGSVYATQFSNREDSHQSSLGFYITGGTYTGQHGYSLKLKGCEPGINSNAESRNIVVHAADYVSPDYIHRMGFAGRSHGCPAVPEALHQKIIDLVKNGSCLYIYHNANSYKEISKILNADAAH